MSETDMVERFVKEMEDLMFATIAGPPQKQRQTALRLRGRSFETVELDGTGRVIEPMQCNCGSHAVIHQPRCPFALICA